MVEKQKAKSVKPPTSGMKLCGTKLCFVLLISFPAWQGKSYLMSFILLRVAPGGLLRIIPNCDCFRARLASFTPSFA